MHFDPAPFWRRLLARLLDLLFALILTFVLVVPVTLIALPVMSAMERADVWGPVGGSTCLFLAYVALETFLLVRRDGQTLGKGLMGLRVAPRAPESSRLSLSAALVRLLVLLAPFVLISVAGGILKDTAAGTAVTGLSLLVLLSSLILTSLRSSGGRAVHDLLAGSRVVVAAKRGLVLRGGPADDGAGQGRHGEAALAGSPGPCRARSGIWRRSVAAGPGRRTDWGRRWRKTAYPATRRRRARGPGRRPHAPRERLRLYQT